MPKQTKGVVEVERQCGTCKFWKEGDVSIPGHVGNYGCCNFFLARTADFYEKLKAGPFWTKGMVRQTVEWEGAHCPMWEV